MDVLKLLEEIEEILEDSSNVPFSGKIMVDKAEILNVVKEIRTKLPDEIKQAEWIKRERQRILIEAQSEADNMSNEARLHIEAQIDQNEITKSAQEGAEKIIQKAQNNAKEIRIGAKEYADEILTDIQKYIREIDETLEGNKSELKGSK